MEETSIASDIIIVFVPRHRLPILRRTQVEHPNIIPRHRPCEPCQILLCKKRSYKLAFADPFAMLSRPHVLLSRALVSLELLSRVFRGGTFFGYFRDKLSQAFAACVLAFAGIL